MRWLVVCAVLVAPCFAWAGEVDDLKLKADAAMDAHHYDEAIAAYTSAYEKSPNPAFLYNRCRAYEAHGDYALAYDDLERFKSTAPPELRARVPKLDELLQSLKTRFSTFDLSVPVAGARVIVGGREVGTTPLAPVRLPSGKATLEIVAEGHFPYKKEIDLQGGTTTHVDAALVPKATNGILAITTTPPGAAITVDTTPIGLSPTEGIFSAGGHAILARADGFDALRSQAVVVVGQRNVVTLTLHKRHTILESPVFWTVVGVVVAGAIVGTSVALLTERAPDAGAAFSPNRISGP